MSNPESRTLLLPNSIRACQVGPLARKPQDLQEPMPARCWLGGPKWIGNPSTSAHRHERTYSTQPVCEAGKNRGAPGVTLPALLVAKDVDGSSSTPRHVSVEPDEPWRIKPWLIIAANVATTGWSLLQSLRCRGWAAGCSTPRWGSCRRRRRSQVTAPARPPVRGPARVLRAALNPNCPCSEDRAAAVRARPHPSSSSGHVGAFSLPAAAVGVL